MPKRTVSKVANGPTGNRGKVKWNVENDQLTTYINENHPSCRRYPRNFSLHFTKVLRNGKRRGFHRSIVGTTTR